MTQPLPRAAKGTGLIIESDQLSYTSVQGRSEYLSVARGYLDLPRIENPEIAINKQMSGAMRRRMRMDVLSPIIKDLAVSSAYRSLSFSLTAEMNLFREQLSDAISRQLRRDYALLRRQGFNIDVSKEAHALRLSSSLSRVKSEMEFVGSRASNLYNKTFTNVSKQLNLAEPNTGVIARHITPNTYERVNHPSLSRGLASLERTSLQRARMSAQANLYVEAGVEFVYWRLSSSHKDYGGSEVCEVLASSTGNIASRTRNEQGIYSLREAPQAPHPNCMCSLVATK